MKKTMILVSILILAASISLAAIPTKINYQGVLKDSAGNVINNPSLSIVFSIYSGVSGGTPLWTETQSVSIEAGLYNVQLGGVTAIPADGSVFDGSTRYLGITVGTDTEMTPRLPMVSVPYAYYAKAAESAVTSANAVSAESATRLGSYLPAQTGGGSFIPVTSSGKLDSSVVPTNLTTTGTAAATRVENSSVYENAEALTGVITSTTPGDYSAGIRGINNGTGGSGSGVYGSQAGSGWGVYGRTPSGRGVFGYSETGTGVYGLSSDIGQGVYGHSNGSGEGVSGYSFSGAGVKAISSNGLGLYAWGSIGAISAETDTGAITIRGNNSLSATGAIGVAGYALGTGAVTNYGVYGESLGDDGRGVYGRSFGATGTGVWGRGSGTGGIGVYGSAPDTSASSHFGGYFYSDGSGGTGIYAVHNAATGTAPGILAESSSTTGNATAITGKITSTGPGGYSAAVRGINNGTDVNGAGVWGSQAGAGWGVYGTVNSSGIANPAAGGYFYNPNQDGVALVADSMFFLTPRSGAPATPREGMIYYDSATHTLQYYNGTIWKTVSTL